MFAFEVQVHPIDTFRHPDQPPGWRWAVLLGGACLNAGWAPSQGDAAIIGEAVSVVAVRTAHMCGQSAEMHTTFLDDDPTIDDFISIGA